MRSIHTAVIVVFLSISLLLMSPFKSSPIHPIHSTEHTPFTGTYLSEKEDELSWITLTEQEKNQITCEWQKLKLMQDGRVTQQGYVLKGKIAKEGLSMVTHISNPKRFVLFANAIREEGNIRMSLSAEEKVFHTGLYRPTGLRDIMSAKSKFLQEAEIIEVEKEKNRKAHLPPEDEAFKERQINISLIKTGNYYVGLLREFREEHKKIAKQFDDKTTSMALYLEHTKGTHRIRQISYRNQYLQGMKEILDSTRKLQNNQDALQSRLNSEVISFLDGLKKRQKICTQQQDAKSEAASMCRAIKSLEDSIGKQSAGTESMFSEIRESYRINSEKQQKMINEAEEYIKTNAVE